MKIVCDRCNNSQVDYDFRNDWMRIETSIKGRGKIGDYFLCPNCRNDFYNFIDNKTVNIKEEQHETDYKV